MENILALTKIKQVRAWFTGGATAKKALAAVIITTRGAESLDRRSYCHPDE